MQAIKDRFDPHDILNRGRFIFPIASPSTNPGEARP
jgi:hypothetical protein